MLPLKVAVLWHFHQPYYKKENEFTMPWVRLHGVKDYNDLLEIFHEFPNFRQTINVVPSLRMQIDEYINYTTQDKVQRLTKIKANELSDEQKREILRLFFLCNVETMVMPYPRYKDLFEKSGKNPDNFNLLSNQEFLDLQVWYNLTWLGQFSRQKPLPKRLFIKGGNYTEEEKVLLLSIHNEILSQIKPQLKMLSDFGQIEVSCSPMYHPILPLLCNSNSVREAMPNAQLPEPIFTYPQDAEAQIVDAISYIEDIVQKKPQGMWPSEGSVSTEVIELIAKSGLKWFASDEEVLQGTIQNDYNFLDKYFPRKFEFKTGSVAGLFRDHHLSDLIGFVYSRWNPYDAVADFCSKLRNIRNELVKAYGENCLQHAVVPVILDGENCWEYYHDNGLHFLREFARQLSNSSDFQTITCSEATKSEHLSFVKPLKKIKAGSWINGNFKIWLGHQEHVTAWSYLGQARKALELSKAELSEEEYKKALNELYIAEGSDWFWWYGDEHKDENGPEFDQLFRWHLLELYRIIDRKAPEELFESISGSKRMLTLVQQQNNVNPIIDGKSGDDSEWIGAGYYDPKTSMSAMHQIGVLLEKLWFASNHDDVFFRCDTVRKLGPDDIIDIQIHEPKSISIIIRSKNIEIFSEQPLTLRTFRYSKDEIVELSLSRSVFEFSSEEKQSVKFSINTRSLTSELHYPRQGMLEVFV